MPRTIRVYYGKDKGLRGRCRMNFNWPPISRKSVVHITAAEAFDLPTGSIFGTDTVYGLNLGDADISISNVSPHDGGVEFILHVGWDTPLNVEVTISVFEDPEQVSIQ